MLQPSNIVGLIVVFVPPWLSLSLQPFSQCTHQVSYLTYLVEITALVMNALIRFTVDFFTLSLGITLMIIFKLVRKIALTDIRFDFNNYYLLSYNFSYCEKSKWMLLGSCTTVPKC